MLLSVPAASAGAPAAPCGHNAWDGLRLAEETVM